MERKNILIIGIDPVSMHRFKEAIERISDSFDTVVITESGNPHDDISKAVDLMKYHHPKVIQAYSNVQQSIEEIKKYKPDFDTQGLIDFCAATTADYETILKSLAERISYAERSRRRDEFHELTANARPFVNTLKDFEMQQQEDMRPFYLRAENKGGKKRKNRYHHKNKW